MKASGLYGRCANEMARPSRREDYRHGYDSFYWNGTCKLTLIGFGRLITQALLALLKDTVTETLGTRQGDNWLIILVGDGEHVRKTGGESTALAVLNVHNLERTDVLLATGDNTDTALILTLSDHTLHTDLELEHVDALASGDVHLDNVVVLGIGVWVPDGATIVGGDAWDTLGSDAHGLHAGQLVAWLVSKVLGLANAVEHEAALCVVQQTEVLIGLLDGHDIHESNRVVGVSAHLAVDLDQTLHEDLLDFLLCQRILEAIAEDQDQRQALTELVRTSGRTRGPGASHLVKHPVLWRSEALHMFLRSTCLK